jgi:hypothetical protein
MAKLGSDLPVARSDRSCGAARTAKSVAASATDLAVEKAQEGGHAPNGLEPQSVDAMPHRGLAHRADGSPTSAAQRHFIDPDSHIMKGDGNLLQGYNC